MPTPDAPKDLDPLRDIVSARSFDAPRERVFEAFRDPSLLARWWGPKGFANTIHELDVRPGGHWRSVLHAPDGRDFANHSLFLEVVRPERIVFRHVSEEHPFELAIVLEEQGTGTRMTWRMRHETAEACAKVKPYVVPANEENFDRLAEVLAGMNPVPVTSPSKPPPPGWPRLSSALFYADPAAAIDWLCRALGFEVKIKVLDAEGRVEHSELVCGEALVMVGGEHRADWRKGPGAVGGANTQSLLLYVDDADAHCARARAAGARIVREPEDVDYGEGYWVDRGYEAIDPEGHHWWFYQRLRER